MPLRLGLALVQLEKFCARLAVRGIALTLSEDARAFLVKAGYEPAYGARPLKRAIQTLIENPLAREIVAGRIFDGQPVVADAGDTGLVFQQHADVK